MRAASRGWTRREFVTAAGLGVLAASTRLAPAARAARADDGVAPAPGVRAFVSRPDLTPPAVTVSTPASGTQPGLVFTAPFTGPGQYGPLMIDDTGDPVWFLPVSTATTMNFRVQRYRRAPVLTWWEGKVGDGYGGGVGVIADHTYRELARVKAGKGYQSDLHEFLISSRGTALIAIYSQVGADLSAVGGPVAGQVVEGVIQEIDIPTGRVLFEWHSLDHVDITESYRSYPTDPGLFDYFHLNSVGVDTDGNLIVSGRHTSTVYKIDRKTGAVIWRLGGKKSDIALGPSASFSFQHDARRHADGTITLFDNGAWGPAGVVEQFSRPLRLQLDTTAMTARLAHAYAVADQRLAVAMGDLQVLPDGGAFVGWGTAGSFSEISADGPLRFDAHFTGKGLSYRAFRYPWVGRPKTNPTVVTRQDPAGTTIAYVSWNGATEVASWRLESGARPGALRPVGAAPRTGFETTITVPALTGYVSVAALDSRNTVLGTSTPARV